MKKNFSCGISISSLALGIIFYTACSHDYLRYDTEMKDGVYMILKDSAKYSFDNVKLIDSATNKGPEIHLLGMPKDYDREIGFEIVDSLTTAVENIHYYLSDLPVLKAGELQTIIGFTFYRTRDPKLSTKPVYITFRLIENEHFRIIPGMVSPVFRYKIESKLVSRPIWWNDTYLGPYSQTLYAAFVDQYMSLEATNPLIFKTLDNYFGYYFSNQINVKYMWERYEYPMVKYVVHPLYDYYLEHPDPKVKIPVPKF